MHPLNRYRTASEAFAAVLRQVHPDQWTAPTPCREWDVRALVNHMTQGNRNYTALLHGATAADFLRTRDSSGSVGSCTAFTASAAEFAAAFGAPGALDRILDYPLGPTPARQMVAIRTTDSLIHTWDLARAVGAPETLDPDLVTWATVNLEATYAGLSGLDRFFAAPAEADPAAGAQDRLLHRLGRRP